MNYSLIVIWAFSIAFFVLIIAYLYHQRTNDGSGLKLGKLAAIQQIGLAFTPSVFMLIFWRSAPLSYSLGIPLGSLGLVLLSHSRWIFFPDRYKITAPFIKSGVSVGDPVLRVCHLSDIHFTTTKTMEGNLDRGAVTGPLINILQRATKPDVHFILITGDLTDAAEEAEWQVVIDLLKSFGDEVFRKILFIPGNHDLLTVRTKEPKNTFQYHGQELAANNLLKFLSLDWEICTQNMGRKTLQSLLDELADYIQLYENHKPFYNESKIANPFSKARFQLPAHLGKLTPVYEVSPVLIDGAKRWETKYEWPNREFFLVQDFVNTLYPMVFHEDKNFIIIGLNSCVWPCDGFLNSAIGRIGEAQLRKLSAILKATRDKCKLIMVHHHLGLPWDLLKKVTKSYKRNFDPLLLADRKALLRVLSKHNKVVVFNGHRHIGYHASINNQTQIISSASLSFGDEADKQRENCFIYDVTSSGEVGVVEKLFCAKPKT